ncbi:MAG: OmpA family protein [Sterolibacterium sp.]
MAGSFEIEFPFDLSRQCCRSAYAVFNAKTTAHILTTLIVLATPTLSFGATIQTAENADLLKRATEIQQQPPSTQPNSEKSAGGASPGPNYEEKNTGKESIVEPESDGDLPEAPALTEGTLLRASNANSIYFAYGSAKLTNSAVDWIRRHAERLRAKPILTVTLYGYADDFASSSYSVALGELRARTVRDKLLSLKVSPSQIRIINYGHEKSPSVRCQTEICHESYRRVAIRYESSRN